jgi:hypothetical protein
MQQGHPIAYLSKGLGPKNVAMSTYEKECLALLMAVDKGRPIYSMGSLSSPLTIRAYCIWESRNCPMGFNIKLSSSYWGFNIR